MPARRRELKGCSWDNPHLDIFGDAKPNGALIGSLLRSDKPSPPNTLNKKKKKERKPNEKSHNLLHLFFMELHRRAKVLQPSVKREGNS